MASALTADDFTGFVPSVAFNLPPTNNAPVYVTAGQLLGKIDVDIIVAAPPRNCRLVGVWIVIDQASGASGIAAAPKPDAVPPYLKSLPAIQINGIPGAAYGAGIFNTLTIYVKYQHNTENYAIITGPHQHSFTGLRTL